jgi:hypothetical protein
MPKKKQAEEKENLQMVFTKSGNLASGERFKAGETVPDSTSAEEIQVLFDLDAVTVKERD